MPSRYFTKSVFKVALACPARLNYVNNPEYANQDVDNDFLEALAEGGFQVGELAKVYYGVPAENDLKDVPGHEAVLSRTRELLAQENVVIAEAAFRWQNCFVKADIISKQGNTVELIEVKAKSWGGEKDRWATARKVGDFPKGSIRSDIRPYVYDVAFQKYVVQNALAEMFPGQRFEVKAALMMADKTKVADIDHVNQFFRIRKENGRIGVVREPGWEALLKGEHVLTAYFDPVDALCDSIIPGTSLEQPLSLHGRYFKDFVTEMASWYVNGEKHYAPLSLACYQCPFYAAEGDIGKKDGYDECWRTMTAPGPNHYEGYTARPLLEELWGGGDSRLKGRLFAEGKYYLDQVGRTDLTFNSPKYPGLVPGERKAVQIAMATHNDALLGESAAKMTDGVYLDVEGLRTEMAKWKFPIHMIDFETSAVALPFYKGMQPYESVAFQFSHHVIEKTATGYKVRHAGEWINTSREFPNFAFVRELKRQLEQDDGTIFRYCTHENTILRCISRQLRNSSEPDREELLAFIDSITHTTHEEGDAVFAGPRDMVDLWEVVKGFYLSPLMKGSNSIKAVLPAILSSSDFLFQKYSRPIYGTEVESARYAAQPIAWITEKGENPYKHLAGVSTFLPDEGSRAAAAREEQSTEELPLGEQQVNNGGAALWAYGLLQFCEQDSAERAALIEALLRYCELDTLSMVFLWEYFNDKCKA